MKLSKIAFIILFLGCAFGWVNNVLLLTESNFEAPYKNEIIRGAGIFIFPVGVIAGYIEIND